MKKLALVCLALSVVAAPLAAIEPGTWLLKVGAHNVDPKSDNGSVLGGTVDLEVGSSLRPTVMAEYFVAPDLGIEVLAAWPFSHDVETGGVRLGTVDQLPPTVSLQYHFNGDGAVSPFVGAGVNYTLFFSEKSRGPIAGSKLELDPSFGYALHAGVDFRANDRWSVGVDVRYIDIDSDVKLDGVRIGTAEIDPIAYGAYAAIRF